MRHWLQTDLRSISLAPRRNPLAWIALGIPATAVLLTIVAIVGLLFYVFPVQLGGVVLFSVAVSLLMRWATRPRQAAYYRRDDEEPGAGVGATVPVGPQSRSGEAVNVVEK